MLNENNKTSERGFSVQSFIDDTFETQNSIFRNLNRIDDLLDEVMSKEQSKSCKGEQQDLNGQLDCLRAIHGSNTTIDTRVREIFAKLSTFTGKVESELENRSSKKEESRNN